MTNNVEKTFKFSDNNTQVVVNKLKGDEKPEEKTLVFKTIATYLSKHSDQTWQNVCSVFTMHDSAAYHAINASESLEQWTKAVEKLSPQNDAQCPNNFGILVKGLTVHKKPMEHFGNIQQYARNIVELTTKKNPGWEKTQKDVMKATINEVVRDMVTSMVYPAQDYRGDPMDIQKATSMDISLYYQNHATGTKSSIALNARDGEIFGPRWKKDEKADDESKKAKEKKITCNVCHKKGHKGEDLQKQKAIRKTQSKIYVVQLL
jgi:hypothetical protein